MQRGIPSIKSVTHESSPCFRSPSKSASPQGLGPSPQGNRSDRMRPAGSTWRPACTCARPARPGLPVGGGGQNEARRPCLPHPSCIPGSRTGTLVKRGHTHEPGLEKACVAAAGTPTKEPQAHLLATAPSLTTGLALASPPRSVAWQAPLGRLGRFFSCDEDPPPGSENGHQTRTRHPSAGLRGWRLPAQSPHRRHT